MSKAAATLEKFGVDYEMTIISAHREPDELIDWCRSAEDRGVKVMIAGAGMAAALPGMCAALFALPVIGVPLSGKNLDGMDAVFSIMQMPPGVPVATVAVDGAMNAALLAMKILASSDEELLNLSLIHILKMWGVFLRLWKMRCLTDCFAMNIQLHGRIKRNMNQQSGMDTTNSTMIQQRT